MSAGRKKERTNKTQNSWVKMTYILEMFSAINAPFDRLLSRLTLSIDEENLPIKQPTKTSCIIIWRLGCVPKHLTIVKELRKEASQETCSTTVTCQSNIHLLQYQGQVGPSRANREICLESFRTRWKCIYPTETYVVLLSPFSVSFFIISQ